MILSDHSIHMIPHQGSRSHLFSLFLIRLFGGAQDRWWRGSMLALHILQSQKPDPMEKTSHTIRSRCACVFGTHTSFAQLYLLFLFWDMGYLSFSFFMLLGMDIFFLVLLRSPHLSAWWTQRVVLKWWSIFVWTEGIFLRNFWRRSQRMSSRVRESKKNQQQWARKLISRISSNGNNMRSVRDLDLKSMKWISQGSQIIWQRLMQKRVAYVLGF